MSNLLSLSEKERKQQEKIVRPRLGHLKWLRTRAWSNLHHHVRKRCITSLGLYMPVCFRQSPPHKLACRRHAFTVQNIPFFQVCAVPSAAVRRAGMSDASRPLVGAAAKHAFIVAAAVISAETLAIIEAVVQPATEHGFFPPPWLTQCEDPD